MGRRERVRYTLDTGGIRSLPQSEIKAILRGADELIATGGRTMLAKLLKGSKDKKVLEHGLDKCPVYGFYHSLTMEEISHQVDWTIRKGYIKLEYSGQLPVVAFSEKGWEIERETYGEEIYQRFCQDMKGEDFPIIYEMKDVNRQVVFDVLEKIRASRNTGFLPVLEAWKKTEVRKVRERIDSVEETLKNLKEGPVVVCLKAQKSDTNRIARLTETTIRNIYPKCYPEEVIEFFLFLHNECRIEADIEAKNVWILLCDGKLVGTGSLDGNHIKRVFVHPEQQGKGLGGRIMEKLESEARENYDCVELDSSIPAEKFYEKRGYRVKKEESQSVGTTFLQYKVMEKRFSGQQSDTEKQEEN